MSGCLYTFAFVRQNLCKYIRGMSKGNENYIHIVEFISFMLDILCKRTT